MQMLTLLIALLVSGADQAKPAASAPPVMPYAADEDDDTKEPARMAVIASCAGSADSIHGACEERLASALSQEFMPRADQSADAVASVAAPMPAATAGPRRPSLMPRADDSSCVRFLPCCRERMPCCSDAPVGSERCAHCRRGVCGDAGACMPRADEAAIAPLFLPCARQLEWELAEGIIHQPAMPAADERGTDVRAAAPFARTMPRADEEPMLSQAPMFMPRAEGQIEKHAALTPSY